MLDGPRHANIAFRSAHDVNSRSVRITVEGLHGNVGDSGRVSPRVRLRLGARCRRTRRRQGWTCRKRSHQHRLGPCCNLAFRCLSRDGTSQLRLGAVVGQDFVRRRRESCQGGNCQIGNLVQSRRTLKHFCSDGRPVSQLAEDRCRRMRHYRECVRPRQDEVKKSTVRPVTANTVRCPDLATSRLRGDSFHLHDAAECASGAYSRVQASWGPRDQRPFFFFFLVLEPASRLNTGDATSNLKLRGRACDKPYIAFAQANAPTYLLIFKRMYEYCTALSKVHMHVSTSRVSSASPRRPPPYGPKLPAGGCVQFLHHSPLVRPLTLWPELRYPVSYTVVHSGRVLLQVATFCCLDLLRCWSGTRRRSAKSLLLRATRTRYLRAKSMPRP